MVTAALAACVPFILGRKPRPAKPAAYIPVSNTDRDLRLFEWGKEIGIATPFVMEAVRNYFAAKTVEEKLPFVRGGQAMEPVMKAFYGPWGGWSSVRRGSAGCIALNTLSAGGVFDKAEAAGKLDASFDANTKSQGHDQTTVVGQLPR